MLVYRGSFLRKMNSGSRLARAASVPGEICCQGSERSPRLARLPFQGFCRTADAYRLQIAHIGLAASLGDYARASKPDKRKLSIDIRLKLYEEPIAAVVTARRRPQNRPMQFGGSLRETTENDPSEGAWRFPERGFGRRDGDRRRLRRRKSVDARRDGGKSDTLALARGLDRAAIAGSQQVRLAVRSPAPNRADGVDDQTRGQLKTRRRAHLARRTSADRAASFRQLGPCSAMNRAVDAPAARELGVGGVDDRVDFQGCDVGDDDFKLRLAQARHAPAWLFTRTPASASMAASSPDWNISRVMSQPPTNSPLM